MPEWLIGTLITVGVGFGTTLAISLFAKALPKEQTFNGKIKPLVERIADALNLFLKVKVGSGNAEKIEESVICTVCYWIENAFRVFYERLTQDNKNELAK